MPCRTPSPKSRSRRTKSSRTSFLPQLPTNFSAWLRLLRSKLLDLTIGFGLISALSFVPPTVTEQWGPNAQWAVAVASDIRTLVLDIAVDTGTLVLDTGSSLFTEVTSDFDWSTLTAWLPQLEQLDRILPDRDALPHPAPPGQAGDLPQVAGSFSRAKDLLYDNIYRGHRITAYYGCRYNGSRRTDLNSCGMQQYAGDTRADRVEAEHVFPVFAFGR